MRRSGGGGGGLGLDISFNINVFHGEQVFLGKHKSSCDFPGWVLGGGGGATITPVPPLDPRNVLVTRSDTMIAKLE